MSIIKNKKVQYIVCWIMISIAAIVATDCTMLLALTAYGQLTHFDFDLLACSCIVVALWISIISTAVDLVKTYFEFQ